jgi:diguanylate cyclase (GGDEF)-like protein
MKRPFASSEYHAPAALKGEGDVITLASLARATTRLASANQLEQVMDMSLTTAKLISNAVQTCLFMERQGTVDESISIYKSIPELPESAIRDFLSDLGDTSKPLLSRQEDSELWILPMIARSRHMGALVLWLRRRSNLRRKRFQMLRFLASHTALVLDNLVLSINEWTRLPNLSVMKAIVSESLGRAGKCTAVFFIDIDNFKEVNARVGYLGGADLLMQFARRLKDCPVIQRGTLGHISGDEFLFATTCATDGVAAAKQVAGVIQQALREPFVVHTQPLTVTASIGISVVPSDGCSVSELFDTVSDAALLAKREGKNTYILRQISQ